MTRVGIPNTELRVSRIALGAGAWGASLSGSALDRLLEDYLEAGGNFLDTAHCYAFWTDAGAGSSERELGAAVRRLGVRGEVVIATKGGHPDGGASYPRPDAYMAPDVLRQDLHESLERLGVDHVDLYYLHRDDPRAPVAEALDCLNQEIAAGRVRHIGASNWSLARLAEANEYAARAGLQGFVVSQMQWSLATPGWSITEDPTMRCIRSEDVAWHVETGAPVVAYTATAGGSFAASAPGGLVGHAREPQAARPRAASVGGVGPLADADRARLPHAPALHGHPADRHDQPQPPRRGSRGLQGAAHP